MMYFQQWSSVLSWIVIAFSSFPHLVSSYNWQENVRPKLFAQLTNRDYQSFVGTIQLSDQGLETGDKLLLNRKEKMVTKAYCN